MKTYAVTYGNKTGRGGFDRTGLLVVEAQDSNQAWDRAEANRAFNERVLYVEEVHPYWIP